MNSEIITAEELRELTGQQYDGHVVNYLIKDGIPFFQGKAGPWTTMELLTIAGKRKLGLPIDKEEEPQGVM